MAVDRGALAMVRVPGLHQPLGDGDRRSARLRRGPHRRGPRSPAWASICWPRTWSARPRWPDGRRPKRRRRRVRGRPRPALGPTRAEIARGLERFLAEEVLPARRRPARCGAGSRRPPPCSRRSRCAASSNPPCRRLAARRQRPARRARRRGPPGRRPRAGSPPGRAPGGAGRMAPAGAFGPTCSTTSRWPVR